MTYLFIQALYIHRHVFQSHSNIALCRHCLSLCISKENCMNLLRHFAVTALFIIFFLVMYKYSELYVIYFNYQQITINSPQLSSLV